MTALREVYRCNICGNIVEVLHTGQGELVCCGEPMELLPEKASDAGQEKHVPVIAAVDGGLKVRVGTVPHPMEEKHYIEWVEVSADGESCRRFLKPGEPPEADFKAGPKPASAREYCSIHGLWKSA